MEPGQVALVKFLNRHQLNGRHSQVLEVRNLFHEPTESSGTRHTRTRMNREAANVCFVNDRVGGGVPQRNLAFPVKMLILEDALRRGRRVAQGGKRQIASIAGPIVA